MQLLFNIIVLLSSLFVQRFCYLFIKILKTLLTFNCCLEWFFLKEFSEFLTLCTEAIADLLPVSKRFQVCKFGALGSLRAMRARPRFGLRGGFRFTTTDSFYYTLTTEFTRHISFMRYSFNLPKTQLESVVISYDVEHEIWDIIWAQFWFNCKGARLWKLNAFGSIAFNQALGTNRVCRPGRQLF